MPPNDELEITIDGPPIPQARPRIARMGALAHAYDPNAKHKKITAAAAIDLIAQNEWSLSSADHYTVRIDFFVPYPAAPHKKNFLSWNPHATSKPDLDNLAKYYLDALNNIAWFDDQQITQLQLRKQFSLNPKTVIHVTKKNRKNISSIYEIVFEAISREETELLAETALDLNFALELYRQCPCETHGNILVEVLAKLATDHAKTLNRIKKSVCPSKAESPEK